MTKLTHTVEIQRPLSEVYGLARQVERYPEFLPGYVESRIVQRRESGALLEIWRSVATAPCATPLISSRETCVPVWYLGSTTIAVYDPESVFSTSVS